MDERLRKLERRALGDSQGKERWLRTRLRSEPANLEVGNSLLALRPKDEGQIAQTLAEHARLVTPNPVVIVDYRLTMEQMIEAGKYNEVRRAITESNFPHERGGVQVVQIELIHLGAGATVHQLMDEFHHLNLRFVVGEELLSLGAQYPDLLQQLPICSFGPRCLLPGVTGGYMVLCGNKKVSRALSLGYYETWWGYGYRFAGVHKSVL